MTAPGLMPNPGCSAFLPHWMTSAPTTSCGYTPSACRSRKASATSRTNASVTPCAIRKPAKHNGCSCSSCSTPWLPTPPSGWASWPDSTPLIAASSLIDKPLNDQPLSSASSASAANSYDDTPLGALHGLPTSKPCARLRKRSMRKSAEIRGEPSVESRGRSNACLASVWRDCGDEQPGTGARRRRVFRSFLGRPQLAQAEALDEQRQQIDRAAEADEQAELDDPLPGRNLCPDRRIVQPQQQRRGHRRAGQADPRQVLRPARLALIDTGLDQRVPELGQIQIAGQRAGRRQGHVQTGHPGQGG